MDKCLDCDKPTCPTCGFCPIHAYEANRQGEGVCYCCQHEVARAVGLKRGGSDEIACGNCGRKFWTTTPTEWCGHCRSAREEGVAAAAGYYYVLGKKDGCAEERRRFAVFVRYVKAYAHGRDGVLYKYAREWLEDMEQANATPTTETG